MRLKDLLYWTAVVCAVAQILMSLYARFYGDVAGEIQAAVVASPDSELAVVKGLNYAFPVGVGCLLLLIYSWNINRVSGFAMVFAVGLQVAAADLNLRAARHVFGQETSLASIAWWAPGDKAPTVPEM